ncbi:hypothetical protein AMTR_s00023p00226790 [Amborella trichopoda]|uniref:Uncharacterized protein n=1 Tax=Amborella trichopoda TaxID=13333 RepID=W1NJU1_AMBTC|nr:hypothetical protein AMTR_s00023p00226790 [Amborella trichopoda]
MPWCPPIVDMARFEDWAFKAWKRKVVSRTIPGIHIQAWTKDGFEMVLLECGKLIEIDSYTMSGPFLGILRANVKLTPKVTIPNSLVLKFVGELYRVSIYQEACVLPVVDAQSSSSSMKPLLVEEISKKGKELALEEYQWQAVAKKGPVNSKSNLVVIYNPFKPLDQWEVDETSKPTAHVRDLQDRPLGDASGICIPGPKILSQISKENATHVSVSGGRDLVDGCNQETRFIGSFILMSGLSSPHPKYPDPMAIPVKVLPKAIPTPE